MAALMRGYSSAAGNVILQAKHYKGSTWADLETSAKKSHPKFTSSSQAHITPSPLKSSHLLGSVDVHFVLMMVAAIDANPQRFNRQRGRFSITACRVEAG